jgi:hypothetical protein
MQRKRLHRSGLEQERTVKRVTIALITLGATCWWPNLATAQPNLGSALPNPRLFTVTPPGGQAGKVVEMTFTGTDLEEPQTLRFSAPGIKAEPIVPPAPPAPPVDPKKPAPNPPPKLPPPPPVTKFKVTIPAQTPVGIYDVRLVGKWGVSNPRAFVVGDLPEVLEKEPNNDVEQAQRVDLNSTVNGVINAPTDVDYYVFAGKKGQRVLLSCLTSSIDSRLHAGLEVYNKAGRKLAFNHMYHGHDALADCTLAEDGDYWVRVFSFTYIQGSSEHFYRLTISTAPWIDAVYPPMVEPGKTAQLTVYGRNLPGGQPDPTAKVGGRVLEKLVVSVTAPSDPLAQQRLAYNGHLTPAMSGLDGFEYRLRNATGTSNSFLLTYARAPVVLDNENNDTPETAQEVPVPCEIAGRIEKKRDRDWYSFTAKKGEVYSIEVYAQRLGTPADMYFILRNPATKADIIEQDDTTDTLSPTKFVTRNEDPPRYRFVVPADGKYQLLVSSRDADVRAGPRHLYRVRLTPEQPDFRLIVMPPANSKPDAFQLHQNGNQFFTVLVWRLDGWNGPVNLTVEGLPAGVTCPPQTLATGFKQVPLVLSAAPTVAPGVYEIQIKGTAIINGQTVVREARSASIVWAVQPAQNLPTVSRLDRHVVLAVREPAPFQVTTTLDKATAVQGEKINLTAKLARLSPDFKTPLQATVLDLPPGLVAVNNNQPITFAPGKDEVKAVVDVKANVPPGTYTLVLRGAAQLPFNKDPMAKQKPNINVVQPSNALTLTVLPKQVATLTLPNPTVTVKIGMQSEVVVKVARMYDFAGEFKLQLILPPNVKGLSVDEVTIPAGKDEAKLLLRTAPDMAPANLANLIVRATAMYNGNVPTLQETKLNVNVVK